MWEPTTQAPDLSFRPSLRRVLVTGGRDYKDRALVMRTLDELLTPPGDMVPTDPDLRIIHGGCRTGADQFADDWAVCNWVETEEYVPLWASYGKAAGVMRNARMLADGKPDIVVAFPGNAGTNDMLARARKAGVEIMMVGWDD